MSMTKTPATTAPSIVKKNELTPFQYWEAPQLRKIHPGGTKEQHFPCIFLGIPSLIDIPTNILGKYTKVHEGPLTYHPYNNRNSYILSVILGRLYLMDYAWIYANIYWFLLNFNNKNKFAKLESLKKALKYRISLNIW